MSKRNRELENSWTGVEFTEPLFDQMNLNNEITY